jgi:hypothetical protein
MQVLLFSSHFMIFASFIANDCNWRLKSGGTGANKQIFQTAGSQFELETKKR